MSESDIEVVASLVVQALAHQGRQLPEYSGEKGLADWKERISNPSMWALVKIVDSRIVGVCHGSPERDLAHNELVPGTAHLTGLFVDPDEWGRGFGRELLQGAENLLRARDFTRARLWTEVDNTRAISLYKSEGWKPTGRLTVGSDGAELEEYETGLSRKNE